MALNTGNDDVFFDVMQDVTETDDLLSLQIDPSQPQIVGLDSVTNPIVPDRHISARLRNFDPETFDLSDTSHLTRLLTALIGSGGVGGLRRQMTIARMASTLNGTNFLELDGFWGKLFDLTRDPDTEALPLTNPAQQATDSQTWDTIAGRDGRYRSRIEQLAKGFANGGTYFGMYYAATAVLNCDVNIVESWVSADSNTGASSAGPYPNNTWFIVKTLYPKWGDLAGKSYAQIDGGEANPGATPTGNRGEITVLPGRAITEAERFVLSQVLNKLSPANTIVTIADTYFTAQERVQSRGLVADSNDWQVVSTVVTSDIDDIEATNESARPALSAYTGEKWAYNGRVASVSAYSANGDSVVSRQDYETVTYSDGSQHDYVARDVLVPASRTAMARAAADGVLTTTPYVADRGQQ